MTWRPFGLRRLSYLSSIPGTLCRAGMCGAFSAGGSINIQHSTLNIQHSDSTTLRRELCRKLGRMLLTQRRKDARGDILVVPAS